MADAVLLEAAASEGRAVITDNIENFRPLAAQLLARGRGHGGLILAPSARVRTSAAIAPLAAAIEKVSGDHPDGLASSERWVGPIRRRMRRPGGGRTIRGATGRRDRAAGTGPPDRTVPDYPAFGATGSDRKSPRHGAWRRIEVGQVSSRWQVAPERIQGDRVDAVMLLCGALMKSFGQVGLDPKVEPRGDATTK